MAPAATTRPMSANGLGMMLTNGDIPESGTAMTTGLRALQSAEEKRLFDVVDSLRDFDVHHELNLPQLVVCGSQSSGKSSVLEAISGLPFPRADMTCTRIVTQIQYRRGKDHLQVKILPDKDRPLEDQKILRDELFTTVDLTQLPSMIAQAERRLGISREGFAKDVLKIRITGPGHQPLTLVDLPGLIESHDKGRDYINFVKDITNDWITGERSIILAVVEANRDPENQGILMRAREVDASGERSFGIITKPDIPERGGQLESHWISRAQNLPGSAEQGGLNFKKGWHVLRNSTLTEKDSPSVVRDVVEAKFFEDPSRNWHVIDPRYRGIDSLRQRLSTLLFEHTKRQLPQVRREVDAKLEKCTDELRGLETRLQRPDKLWAEFQKQQKKLSVRVSKGVDGNFNDDMYDDWEGTPSAFLRARIEEQYDAFCEDVVTNGHTLPVPQGGDAGVYLEVVKKMLGMTRGEELTGHSHPQRMTIVFRRHSSRWRAIAQVHVDEAYNHCRSFIEHVLRVEFPRHVPGLPDTICQRMVDYVSKSLKDKRNSAMEELEKLEEDRQRTIKTRNKAFAYKQQQRKDQQTYVRMMRSLNVDDNRSSNVGERDPQVTPGSTRRASGQDDASSQAESVGMDMLIYYDIARDVFVDTVMAQVIERHLLAPLDTLFGDDFDITQATFFALLSDEDYQGLEIQKRALEERIGQLNDCRKKLV